MSRVFRIYNDNANQTITDWQDNAANIYSAANSIEKNIEDPMVSNVGVSKPITSIPSPFAQIDLVKTAFKVVADSKDLKGQTVYHQLVSNALDIAEIFFNIDKLKDKVEILFWDKTDLNSLSSPEHVLVKHVLETYLQDTGYNFDKMDRVFMLNYIGIDRPSSGLNILGGTSPATLFFCSANDLSYASQHISFTNGDKPFDSDIKSLLEREPEFFAYMYALATKNGGLFSELAEYVELCDQQSSNDQKTANSDAKNNYDTLFNDLYVGQNQVSICGIPLKKRNIGVMTEKASQCDFVIKSSKQSSNTLPLVLPVENGDPYSGWSYSNGLWNTGSQCVPVKDDKPLKDRTLPNDGQQYPYLTMDDFLEKTIIRMGGKYNSAYFDGNYNETEEFSYLLPLTDTFFEYFTVEDLKGKVAGEPMIEIKLGPQSKQTVAVKLRIPVNRNNGSGCVVYERQYINSDSCTLQQGTIFPLLDENGMINEDETFMLTLMPRIEFINEKNAIYRVSLLSENAGDYSVKCYGESGPIEETNKNNGLYRSKGDGANSRHQILVVEKSNIKYLRVTSDSCYGRFSGVAVPNMLQEKQGGISFTFAVDFGTSNTHIEYQQGDNQSQAFSISRDDVQLCSIPMEIEEKQGSLDAFQKRLDYEMLPIMTGDDYMFQFPFRTTLCEKIDVDWSNNTYALADVNIPFVYGQRKEYKCNRVRTNLKWIKEHSPRDRFIENICILIRNKVLLNGGDLKKTKIIWSYPLAMRRGQLSDLYDCWEKNFEKYINQESTSCLIPICESLSPYYKSNKATGIVATIDIGGGTTDILVADKSNGRNDDDKIKFITSLKFAANDLFSDDYHDNKMIEHFSKKMEEKLSEFSDLELVMQSLSNVRSDKSANLASFFFSLASNKEVKEKTSSLDFNKILKNDEYFKIVFVIFYASIIYHLAKMMKARDIDVPSQISFSGNGSKILNVLSGGDNLEYFTKNLIEKVYGKPYGRDGLSINIVPNPKEVTCKGNIEYLNIIQKDDSLNTGLSKEMVSNKRSVLLSSGVCFDDVRWKDVKNSGEVDETIKDIQSFMSIIFDLSSGKDNICELFNVDKEMIQVVRECYERNLKNFINGKLSNEADEETVEESLFFFPFSGMLSNIQDEIAKKC